MLEKKTVAVLDETMSTGVAFNTLAHLALSIGNNASNIMGKEQLTDASNINHTGLSRCPFIILKASSIRIRELVNKAKEHNVLLVVDFTEQDYTTYTDEELKQEITQTKEENLKYYGLALFGTAEEIDKLTKNLSLSK